MHSYYDNARVQLSVKKLIRFLTTLSLLVIVCFGISACVGGSVPSEQILRIAPPASGSDAQSYSSDKPVVLFDDLGAFPALERSAVMVARKNVLTPSTRWYWEGAPAALATAALANSLQESSSVTLIWPSRSRVRHSGVLTGRVQAFEVVTPSNVVNISIRLSLWSERGKALVSTTTVTSSTSCSTLSPEAIADAATKGMESIAEQTKAWLAGQNLPKPSR